tara:strand:+ start:1761 stop:1958 length:198 start_codon:yes stop_codon:yes gene_type:complete
MCKVIFIENILKLQDNKALIELDRENIENIEKIDEIDEVKNMIYVTIGLFIWFIIISFVVDELCN